MSKKSTIRHTLEDDHRDIDRILERLFAAFDAGVVAEVLKLLDFFWARLAMHIRAEHIHLFPAILQVFQSTDSRTITDKTDSFEHVESTLISLRAEHNFFMDELALAMKEMRRIVYLRDPAPAYGIPLVRKRVDRVVETLEAHNEIEETELYEWAEKLISSPEKELLTHAIKNELAKFPQRFVGRQT